MHSSEHRRQLAQARIDLNAGETDDGGHTALAELISQVPTSQSQPVDEPGGGFLGIDSLGGVKDAFDPSEKQSTSQPVQPPAPTPQTPEPVQQTLFPSEISFFTQYAGGMEGMGIDISTIFGARPKDALGKPKIPAQPASTEALQDLVNKHLNIQNKLTAQQRAEDKIAAAQRGEDPDFATFSNPDEAQQFIDDNNLSDYTVGLSKDGFVPTPIKQQRQTIDNLIAEALDNGDYDRAVSFNNFKNAPTSDEALKTAMQFASMPADLFTLSAIARGALSLGPRGPGVRSLPRSPLIQQIYERWANQALGNFDFPEIIKESTALPTRAEQAAAPAPAPAAAPAAPAPAPVQRTPDPQAILGPRDATFTDFIFSDVEDADNLGSPFGIPKPTSAPPTQATTPVGGSAVADPFGSFDISQRLPKQDATFNDFLFSDSDEDIGVPTSQISAVQSPSSFRHDKGSFVGGIPTEPGRLVPSRDPFPVDSPSAFRHDPIAFDKGVLREPSSFDTRVGKIPEPIGLPTRPPKPDFTFDDSDEDLGSPFGIPAPVFSQTRFDEGFRNIPHFGLPPAGDEVPLDRARDSRNFQIAAQAGEGPGPSGREGTSSRGGRVLSGDELPSLIPEGTPTFELPFNGVDIPLPVGLEPLFRDENSAIGRPKSIFAQLGIPEISAQSQRNMLPGEMDAFVRLGQMAGIPEGMIRKRLNAQRTGGGQRTSRISSAGGGF